MANTPAGRHMKPGFRLFLIAAGLVIAFFVGKFAISRGYVPAVGILKTVAPTKVTLPETRDADASANIKPVAFPGSNICIQGQPWPVKDWAWNSQMGWFLANGGPRTTCGSIMNKYGVSLDIQRQDSTDQQKADLLACATELKNGADVCSGGAAFVAVMMDGSGQFLAQANAQLSKLGKDYVAEVIGSAGRSDGEDAFLVPPNVRQNPQNAKGLFVGGVIRDGDWDIALKWAGDNDIKNNPDEHTYDPDALNWVNAPDNDFLKAAELYNTNYCEDRKVIKDGRLTGETKNVCVNAVVTWTPGDVNIAKNRGGLIKIVSTKQYKAQMPNAIIGIRHFDQTHADKVGAMLAAIFEGGDQVKAFPQALAKAAQVSSEIYNEHKEEKGKYWETYYKGTQELDTKGLEVDLGGSKAFNLADNLNLFGLAPGSNNNAKATYTTFANIVMKNYGEMFKKTPIPSYQDAMTSRYILIAQSLMDTSAAGQAEKTSFTQGGEGALVSSRPYYITFATGSDQIVGDGVQTMNELKDSLSIAGGTYISIDGYTDNTGSDSVNIPLSKRRAQAVKQWLQRAAPGNFPDSRFAHVEGHGSQNPVAANTSESGKSQNRRVEITLSAQ